MPLLPSLPASAQNDGAAQAVSEHNISPGPLDWTLNELAASAGILLAIDPTLTEGLTSPGLQGSYTLEQAVTQLLAGSGLSYQFTNANTVTLEPLFSFDDGSFELPAISVEGRRFTDRAVGRKQSFNALGEREVLNTPFSVTSYTEELIEATNATTLRDVLTRDASVSSEDQQGGGFSTSSRSEDLTSAAARLPTTGCKIYCRYKVSSIPITYRGSRCFAAPTRSSPAPRQLTAADRAARLISFPNGRTRNPSPKSRWVTINYLIR